MKAKDIMTADVVSVTPTTAVREIASLMSERHISGLPVVDEHGHVLGIVSQSDLLHRPELGTERKRKFWLRMFSDPDELAREYAKSHGMTAADVMSRHTVSVDVESELQQVADTLENHRIKRVPVVQAGKLVGVISRGDIVRALSGLEVTRSTKQLDDGALHKQIIDKLRQASWLDASYINLTVNDGVAAAWGFIKSEDQRSGLRVMMEETEGLKRYEDNLRVGLPTVSGM